MDNRDDQRIQEATHNENAPLLQQDPADQQVVVNPNNENKLKDVQDMEDAMDMAITLPLLAKTFASIIINLILGVLFYWFSTTEAHYGGDGCVTLRTWGFIFGVLCLIFVAVRVIMNLPVLLCCKGRTKFSFLALLPCTECLEAIFALVFLIALTIIWFMPEECGNLKVLTGVYVFTVWTLTLLAILGACCLACCAILASS